MFGLYKVFGCEEGGVLIRAGRCFGNGGGGVLV